MFAFNMLNGCQCLILGLYPLIAFFSFWNFLFYLFILLTIFSCKAGVNYFQPFLQLVSLAKGFEVITWAYLMIVHFERCHFKTFLGISKLPVGDLFYAKNVISHSALHTASRSALINVSQCLHFSLRFFPVNLDSCGSPPHSV